MVNPERTARLNFSVLLEFTMLKNNRFIILIKKNNSPLPYLFSLLLLVIISRYAYKRYTYKSKEEIATTHVAKSFEKMGIMTQEEYAKSREIDKYIRKNNSISDSDLNWWIQLAGRKSSSATEQRNAATLRMIILDNSWMQLTKITPQQKDRLFNLAKIYLIPQQKSEIDEDNKLFGVILVTILDDRRAAPNLQILCDSPYSDMRDTSTKLLDAWKIPHSARK